MHGAQSTYFKLSLQGAMTNTADLATPIVLLFVLALLLLIFSLLLFLKEIQLATRTPRMGVEFQVGEKPDTTQPG